MKIPTFLFNLIVAEIQALQWEKEITSQEHMENSYLVVKKCKYKAGHEKKLKNLYDKILFSCD